MFNGTTNRLLEKTNEELNLLNHDMQQRLSSIEAKLSVQPAPVIPKQSLLLSAITAAGIILLVVLHFYDQSRIGLLKEITERNNQAIDQLNTVITGNTSAFRELQTIHNNTLQVNSGLKQSLDELKEQNITLINMSKKMTVKYRTIQKQVDSLGRQSKPVETSYSN